MIGAVPLFVMSNAVYAAWDGVTPATVLPQAVRLLRGQMRYRGLVMTPDLTSTAPVLDMEDELRGLLAADH